MLDRLATLLGITSTIEIIRGRAERLAAEISSAAKGEARFLGILAALGLAIAATGFTTFVALLIAIVILVDRAWGPNFALAVAVAIPVLLTTVLALTLMARLRRKPHTKPLISPLFEGLPRRTPPSPPQQRPSATAFARSPSHHATGDAQANVRNVLEGAVGEFFVTPLRTGTPLDGIVRRVSGEVSGKSDRTVDLASDLLRTGSRKTMIGVLTATVALGWFLTRRSSRPSA